MVMTLTLIYLLYKLSTKTGIQYLETTTWNPGSKTVLNSLTWGNQPFNNTLMRASNRQHPCELNIQGLSISSIAKKPVVSEKFFKTIS